ncbi:MAG: tetratricopeptide repeat protein [Planctomycetota bacterium]
MTHNTKQYQTVTDSGLKNTVLARTKNNRAIDLLCAGNLAPAEALLGEALIADVDFGPAHNSLGRVYYQQKKYYLAAWEFEYASQLMPGRAEPINNLGLVFEAVGRFEEAISSYAQAVNIDPQAPEYLGNLIRARLANGEKPFYMKREIEDLLLIDDRPEWVQWAKLQLLTDGTEKRILLDMKEQEQNQRNDIAPENFDQQNDGIFPGPFPDNQPNLLELENILPSVEYENE